MIVSMKPPYDITPKILKLISSILEKIGEVNANYLSKQSPAKRCVPLVFFNLHPAVPCQL